MSASLLAARAERLPNQHTQIFRLIILNGACFMKQKKKGVLAR
jgi:hypothetical protein